MRDPNVKIEAVYDEPNEKHLLKIHRFKHGNYKTTTMHPEFVLSADYKKLQESAKMLQGDRNRSCSCPKQCRTTGQNFGEAVSWLLKQAEKESSVNATKGLVR